uniref:Aa_trans domain-containing protein n=1 Tax=Caenorhabditis tropicalis TaxID=1561998 RepID=A0A1I7UAF1_9PELO
MFQHFISNISRVGCNNHNVVASFVKEKNLTVESQLSYSQIFGDITLREALGVLFANTFFFLLDSTSIQAIYTVPLHKDAGFTVQEIMIITAIIIDSPMITLFPYIYSYFPPGFFLPFVISQVVFGIYLYRHMPETKGRAVCDIIESMEQDVFTRTHSLLEEKTPLIRDRVCQPEHLQQKGTAFLTLLVQG